MSTKSDARIKLDQARFFCSQASQAKNGGRDALVTNFEAAIVFARSVTLCLQKEFNDKPGFSEWYSRKQDTMKQDPLFNLFREKRNYILKVGSTNIRKLISVELTEQIGVSDFVAVKVVRGSPWYRRSPKTIWQDICASVKEPLRAWNWKRKMRMKVKRKTPPTLAKVSESYYLDDPAWGGRDAFDLFEEYVSKLEAIVSESETNFSM